MSKQAVLIDGEILTAKEIQERLRAARESALDAARYRHLRKKTWFDGGIAIVREASSIKLGQQCLSHELLDDALDTELSLKRLKENDT